jgi:hypothetical protein
LNGEDVILKIECISTNRQNTICIDLSLTDRRQAEEKDENSIFHKPSFGVAKLRLAEQNFECILHFSGIADFNGAIAYIQVFIFGNDDTFET